ncbi:MAG: transcription repressor NadR [Turicibacter sp.]
METNERRLCLEDMLLKAKQPLKGSSLAKELNVSRQVIVQDIALLRAKGINVVATPVGYIINQPDEQGLHKIIYCEHSSSIDEMREELNIIVGYGGKVIDVIVEHPIYGEIRAMLNIKYPFDVSEFIEKLATYGNKPLSTLTEGAHFHTIEVINEEMYQKIINKLNEKNLLKKPNCN